MAATVIPFPRVEANDNEPFPPPPSTFAGKPLPPIQRRALAKTIDYLIAVLDAVDGDADMEDDDPSGQMDEDEANTGFGHGSDPYNFALLMPEYEQDQSLGPVNTIRAMREWQAREAA